MQWMNVPVMKFMDRTLWIPLHSNVGHQYPSHMKFTGLRSLPAQDRTQNKEKRDMHKIGGWEQKCIYLSGRSHRDFHDKNENP